jgi:hypothetical protein
MKKCPRCKEFLDKSNFGINITKKDGLQAYCNECMKKYRLEHYRNNKEAHYIRNSKKRKIFSNYILSIKNNTPCKDCGIIYNDEPWLTEFDHISKDKVSSVGKLRLMGNFKKLKNEISKCELVCLICHRRRTAKRGLWRV